MLHRWTGVFWIIPKRLCVISVLVRQIQSGLPILFFFPCSNWQKHKRNNIKTELSWKWSYNISGETFVKQTQDTLLYPCLCYLCLPRLVSCQNSVFDVWLEGWESSSGTPVMLTFSLFHSVGLQHEAQLSFLDITCTIWLKQLHRTSSALTLTIPSRILFTSPAFWRIINGWAVSLWSRECTALLMNSNYENTFQVWISFQFIQMSDFLALT